jgi:hypothetical protein
VSWEGASSGSAGLPEPIAEVLRGTIYREPMLVFAVAEHKVPLAGRGGDSQCDVWAFLSTTAGAVSLAVEAKADEPFGQDNEALAAWLVADRSEQPTRNRQGRWDYVRKYLPEPTVDGYSPVPYQLLHRCAAAVIEAKRLQLPNAAFIVQAFEAPAESFEAFSRLCRAVGVKAERGRMHIASVGDMPLGIGWADCPLANDEQVAS